MKREPIPLRVVLDEIAAPTYTTIQFGGGSAILPNGNTFQVSTGSITFTWDPGSPVTAAEVQEMISRLDELARQGRFAQDAFGNAIRMGILGPAKPAKEDIPDSLTGVN